MSKKISTKYFKELLSANPEQLFEGLNFIYELNKGTAKSIGKNASGYEKNEDNRRYHLLYSVEKRLNAIGVDLEKIRKSNEIKKFLLQLKKTLNLDAKEINEFMMGEVLDVPDGGYSDETAALVATYFRSVSELGIFETANFILRVLAFISFINGHERARIATVADECSKFCLGKNLDIEDIVSIVLDPDAVGHLKYKIAYLTKRDISEVDEIFTNYFEACSPVLR